MKPNFVLKGQICHSISPTQLECIDNAYVVCVDGISQGVFRELPAAYAALPLIDHGDKLIFPALTDLHLHAPQFAYRGLGMDLELLDWLQQQAFPEESKYADLDYAERAYAIFTAALRRSATGRACIFATCHRPATELLMQQLEASGLVTYVGKVNMDSDAPDTLREADAATSAAGTRLWLENTSGRFQRTRPILTPRFIPSCSYELLTELQQMQADYDLPVQSHLSENMGEIELVRRLRPHNAFYGAAYDEHHLFGRDHSSGTPVKTIMAHCVWSGAEEVQLMREHGVFIAHCPASNMNVASGIAPMRKYLAGGLKLGLGSDVAGGHTESLFRAITDAIQVSKLYWRLVDQSASPLSFSEVFFLATKGGGEFFGRVGSFAKGYEFDAVVLDDSMAPHPQPLSLRQRLERAVYLQLDSHGIADKYVAGRQIELN